MEQKQLIGGWFIYITILVYLEDEKVENIKGIIKSLSSKKDRRCHVRKKGKKQQKEQTMIYKTLHRKLKIND
jgi:uncharacterized protein YaaQ